LLLISGSSFSGGRSMLTITKITNKIKKETMMLISELKNAVSKIIGERRYKKKNSRQFAIKGVNRLLTG
jgi:hypothetical protein